MYRIVLLILLFVSPSLYADEKSSATKIVKAIVSVMQPSSQKIWFNEKDTKIRDFFHVDSFDKTQKCEDAGVLVLLEETNLSEKCEGVPLLVLDYDLLTQHENAVAAFFWKKGRPNIVFIKKRVEKFAITLPNSYERYQEDEIW